MPADHRRQAWVRPKHPPPKPPQDPNPTAALIPMLRYFAAKPQVSHPNGNSQALIRVPQKPRMPKGLEGLESLQYHPPPPPPVQHHHHPHHQQGHVREIEDGESDWEGEIEVVEANPRQRQRSQGYQRRVEPLSRTERTVQVMEYERPRPLAATSRPLSSGSGGFGGARAYREIGTASWRQLARERDIDRVGSGLARSRAMRSAVTPLAI